MDDTESGVGRDMGYGIWRALPYCNRIVKILPVGESGESGESGEDLYFPFPYKVFT